MATTEAYLKQKHERSKRASEIKAAIVECQRDGAAFMADSPDRNERLQQAVAGSVYESLGPRAPMVLAAHANAVRSYSEARGKLPSDEIFANVHHNLSNLILSSPDEGSNGRVFESVQAMNTTEGVILRDHFAALVMPVALTTITNEFVTTLPANTNRSEIFRIYRKAGTDFGGIAAGTILDESFNGQYGSMDQRKLVGTGDGTEKDFTLNVGQPLKRSGSQFGGYVKVYVDRDLVATDDGNGSILGGTLVGSTVNYDTGVITLTFAVAPATGIDIHVAYDLNIEKKPELIPYIEHEMQSWVLMPHESAIRGEVSLQAIYATQREYNIDLTSMTLSAMRNILSADKDRKRLNDMWFFSKGETEWNMTVPAGTIYQFHYETIRETLLQISTQLVTDNKRSGLTHIVAGKSATNLFRSLKDPHFKAAPGYRETPQPHYVGKLFGIWDLYCDPQASEWEALCIAKGNTYGDAGYVAADAISGVPLKHPAGTDLKFRDTLWELAYRDLHPDNGRAWFTKLIITHL